MNIDLIRSKDVGSTSPLSMRIKSAQSHLTRAFLLMPKAPEQIAITLFNFVKPKSFPFHTILMQFHLIS